MQSLPIIPCFFFTNFAISFHFTVHSSVQALHPDVIHNSRGMGTFCAVDFPSKRNRDNIIARLMNKGGNATRSSQYNEMICCCLSACVRGVCNWMWQ